MWSCEVGEAPARAGCFLLSPTATGPLAQMDVIQLIHGQYLREHVHATSQYTRSSGVDVCVTPDARMRMRAGVRECVCVRLVRARVCVWRGLALPS